jgi:hypothetical protein
VNPSDPERWPALLESLAAQDPEEARIPISQYVWILKRHRWRILGFCAAAVIATVIISARLTPIFESTTTVDVDREMPPGVVGQDAARSVTNDTDQFLATQMKLVQSDGVLRPVDDRLQLRLKEKQSSAGTPRGEAAPIVLKRLRVTRPPNTYSTPRKPAVTPSLIPAPFAPKLPSDDANIGFSSRIPYELVTSSTWLPIAGARLNFHARYEARSAAWRAAESNKDG